MPNIDDVGRPEPEPAVGEIDTLLGFLDFQRATLKWKCAGVSASDMSVKIAASSMTLGGLLKHMTFVENEWFVRWLGDNERVEPWRSVDFSVTPDWEWDTAAHDSPEELFAMWETSVELSRSITQKALDTAGLEQLAKRKWPNGESPSLRWILVHMIEEYARHNGHADLIRESIDGATGE
ncbi:MAG: DinB family protein [Actinobacteria bacterium]|nr:DinB family protein [Actinomycetota bacterium]